MIYFIVNPAAGSGKALGKIKEIERHARSKFRILVTNAPMDAKNLAMEASLGDTVVAVGGDGTIQEVVSGIADRGVSLGIIPGGSGNDFVKSLGISEKLSTAEYLKIIESNNFRAMDLVKMGNFCFANIGSVGLDAVTAQKATRLKKSLGGLSYAAALIECIITFKPLEMYIKADGREISRKYTLAAVCNGSNYGGGFKIAPAAKNDDGCVTLCLIEKMTRPAMLALFPSVMMGKHTNFKEVCFINCKDVSISYSGIQSVNLDGNIYELRGPLNFSIMPGVLKVLC